MKIRVKPETKKDTWELTLAEGHHEGGESAPYIDVLATLDADVSFYLLRIYSNGTFSRWFDVGTPFKVDRQGRLTEVPFKD